MTKTHILGFPRIGEHREMKKTVESYWKGNTDKSELLQSGKQIRQTMWKSQKKLDFVQVGDFAWYDHLLNQSVLFSVIPDRFNTDSNNTDIDTMFRMARGRAPTGTSVPACEMTKWFDTNYHYIVPEFTSDQQFALNPISDDNIFSQVQEALDAGYTPKVVLTGPVTYLWLGKMVDKGDKLALLDKLIPVYKEIIAKLQSLGVNWLQLDEPILAMDMDDNWKHALSKSYTALADRKLSIIVTSYFGEMRDNAELAFNLDVDAIHLDAVYAHDEAKKLLDMNKSKKIVSLGIVNGRNIWKNNLRESLSFLKEAANKVGNDLLWISSSCSLLHSPVNLDNETKLDNEIRSWFAFATQKTNEVVTLRNAVLNEVDEHEFNISDAAVNSRKSSNRIHNTSVQQRVGSINSTMTRRQSSYQQRQKKQVESLQLPLFPTTTIGSFPQTSDIRQTRRQFKNGKLTTDEYTKKMQAEIRDVVERQNHIGLDVLVHGEPERNDMVEYFGEQIDGYVFTDNGWVQSYGSRCVKPPIIYGDISRPNEMTVQWSQYAQKQTDKPMKGMLTGPITMLCWSFVRDDMLRKDVCFQIALALRDEVIDLEKAGISIIQIDEPAIREGLPLRRTDWEEYLQWAVKSFHITADGVKDETQIHTHMCYSEFNDIIESIAAMDADVITIETSRSNMELLDVFERFDYPNEIGPGVYDIHSPNIPEIDWMVQLMQKAGERIPAQRLWINPDCGLKTRDWSETEEALKRMVLAAKQLRQNAQHSL